MAIKRLTIELDDYPETARQTSPPSTLLPKEEAVPGVKEMTDIPSRQDEYREAQVERFTQGTSGRREIVGRTPADLFFAFVNRPEFTATVLTILAFLIFSSKLQSPSDVWKPLVATALFNAVWFVVSGIRKRMASGPKKEDSYTT